MGGLIAENAKLRQEVDELRSRLGLPSLPTPPTGALYGLGHFPATMVPLPNYAYDHTRSFQPQQKVPNMGMESAPEESSTTSSETSGDFGQHRESSVGIGVPALPFDAASMSHPASIPGLSGVSVPTLHAPMITPEYLSIIQRMHFILILQKSDAAYAHHRLQNNSSISWPFSLLKLKPPASTEVKRFRHLKNQWVLNGHKISAFAAALGHPLGMPPQDKSNNGLEFFS
jgi:hypothetical protein